MLKKLQIKGYNILGEYNPNWANLFSYRNILGYY